MGGKKNILRALAMVASVIVIAIALVAVGYLFINNRQESLKEAGRYEGENRASKYRINTEITDDTGRKVYCNMDILKFSGAGYKKVATAIDDYYELDKITERLFGLLDENFFDGESVTLECTRMDEMVISIKEKHRFRTDGAGVGYQCGVTFDVKTGKVLELNDLLKKKKEFNSVIDEFILSQLPNTYPEILVECENYKEIYEEDYKAKGILPEWFLQEDGIGFSFDEGQFLAEAMGYLTVTVPYELVTSYLKPEYVRKEE